MRERAATERYLGELASRLDGSRRSRRRLLVELRDHIDELIAGECAVGIAETEAEQRALARLGTESTIASHWRERTRRARKRCGARVAAAVAIATLASVFAITSAASGRRNPTPQRCPNRTTAYHCDTHPAASGRHN